MVQRAAYRTIRCACMHYASKVGSFPRLASLSKTLYHTCFIREQGYKWWSYRLKLTPSVILDAKPIIYILHY